MKFELEETLRGAPDDDVLDELRRVAKLLHKKTVTGSEFQQFGKCSRATIVRRFGSWNAGLKRAGLELGVQRNITKDDLFENLREIWIRLGRQPRYAEVKRPFSKYSNVTYDKWFGKYSNALSQFVKWVNSDQQENELDKATDPNPRDQFAPENSKKRRSRREITDRQRFRILVRDGFRCKTCGASPLKQSGVELHVDHIVPWSKGGETVDENLECKCSQCNLGKGNAFDV